MGFKRWLACLVLGSAVALTGCGGSSGGGGFAGGGGGNGGGGGDDAPAATTLSGSVVVLGDQNMPAEGATVRVLKADQSELARAATDADGAFKLENLPTDTDVIVSVSYPGATPQAIPVHTAETAAQAIAVNLLTATDVTETRTSVAGGTRYVGADGSQVTFAPGSFVNAQGAVAADDGIRVSITPLNIVARPQGFPGSNRVTDIRTGAAGLMVSGGMADFSFTDAGGNPLNLKPGAKATIRIPLYIEKDLDGHVLAEGDTVPTWTMDSATGKWTEEGTGKVVVSSDSPTGYAVEAEVSHFSWWNIDWIVLDEAVPGLYGTKTVMLKLLNPDGSPYDGAPLLGSAIQPSVHGPITIATDVLWGTTTTFRVVVNEGDDYGLDITLAANESEGFNGGTARFPGFQIRESNLTDRPLTMTIDRALPMLSIYPDSSRPITLHPKGFWNGSVQFSAYFHNRRSYAGQVTWHVDPSTPACGLLGTFWGSIYVAPAEADVPAGGCQVKVTAQALGVTSAPTIVHIRKSTDTLYLAPRGGVGLGSAATIRMPTDSLMGWYGASALTSAYEQFPDQFADLSVLVYLVQDGVDATVPTNIRVPLVAETLFESDLTEYENTLVWSVQCESLSGIACPAGKTPYIQPRMPDDGSGFLVGEPRYELVLPGSAKDYEDSLYRVTAKSAVNSRQGSVMLIPTSSPFW